ncbi:uncharacterized protein TNCV_5099451 [Trichonephila clavipes]|uniref:Mos1 transposase HTH domain-containing protein n=1 Tax=Trichonephila clavipes TaxID=2585209 RepID=A0A8X6RVY0_TRICX|nr:uncharacterized protein TNCV_5099451 [Trichonephila clavipes]
MQPFLKQHFAVKFWVKLDKTSKETHDMIKEAFSGATVGRSGVFEWHKLFREGREESKDHDRPSSGKTNQNVSRVKNLLNC